MIDVKSKTTSLPDGFTERSPEWHFQKFTEFTKYKMDIGEPSPHLAIVGYMSKDSSIERRLWLLGCYAATYCLPTAQVIWDIWDCQRIRESSQKFESWLKTNWKGIVTRTERRCVRTYRKMFVCLMSYLKWMDKEYPKLLSAKVGDPKEYYERVWNSVSNIKYFGRYINIRLVEGLRRYCDIPASLYDIRSIGGWSPKKCLCYLYPQYAKSLLIDDKWGNQLTNQAAYDLLKKVKVEIPKVDEYILAAMLCEYKGAFEKRHQYPGWTIDQEPLLYDKVFDYWGNQIDTKMLWEARKNLFPHEVLGEFHNWNGTRWKLACTLRDFGYNWTDKKFSYTETEKIGDFANPVTYGEVKNGK